MSKQATFNQSRNDMYWSIYDIDDGRIRWIGYDDSFWWDKVSPTTEWRMKIGHVSGRKYTLDPQSNQVSVAS